MAKSYQSFRKRERENRLREKAQLKRERRQRSQEAKKKDAEPAAALGQLEGENAELSD